MEDTHKQIEAVLAQLFNAMMPVCAVVGGIAFSVSAYRSLHYGWHETLILHLCMYSSAMVVLIYRKRLSQKFLFAMLILLIGIDTVQSLFSFGLAGPSIMNLAMMCVLSGFFLGVKAGITILIIGVITISLIGSGICFGHIETLQNLPEHLKAPANWIIQLSCMITYVFPFIIAVDGIKNKLLSSMVDLKKINKEMTAEMATRKAITEHLRTSEEKYRSVIESTIFGFCIIQDGCFQFVNNHLCNIMGYTEEKLMDKQNLTALIHPDDKHRIGMALEQIAKDESNPAEYEIRGIHGDAGIRKLRLFVSALTYNGKQAVCGSIIDITREKELEHQLIQAQKMDSIGRLAGGVAHDFNNMLSVIIGHTELAMTRVSPDQPLFSNLKQIRTAAEHSAGLTRQLLTFARKQAIEPIIIDFNKNIDKMLKMMKHFIGKDIKIAWMPAFGLWPIKFDPVQIDQILANLSVNARDAISGTGKITIKTENAILDETYCADNKGIAPGEYVMLSVSDNGSGMEKDIIDNIFEPFFTTKGMMKGTGLGLSTVYGIVKQNNGFIDVSSELGKGSTFKIYIPRFKDKHA